MRLSQLELDQVQAAVGAATPPPAPLTNFIQLVAARRRRLEGRRA
jgi:hypothetical protein